MIFKVISEFMFTTKNKIKSQRTFATFKFGDSVDNGEILQANFSRWMIK